MFLKMISRFRSSYWLSSGFVVLLSQMSNLVFGFFNFYFLLRILSKYDYGVWTLFISVIAFFEFVKNGFIISPLVRYAIDSKPEERATIQTTSLGLNTLFASIQILIAFIASFFIEGLWAESNLTYLFIVFVTLIVLQVPLTHFNGIQQANMNFKANLFSNATRQFSLFIFILFFNFASYQPTLLMLSLAYICSVILAVIVAYINFRQYKVSGFRISKEWLSRLAIYGKYTFGTNISSMVLRNIDTWMLGGLISPTAVTIYNPAIRVANIIEVPTVSLSSVFFPKLLSRYTKEGDVVAKDLYEKSVGALFALLLPAVITVIIFADQIIYIIAGKDFEETVGILRVAMLTGLIVPFNRQMGIMLTAIGKARIGFYFVLRNASMNVVFCYFFVTHYGTIGAAYAMLMTYIFSFSFNQWYISKYYNIRLINVFKYSIYCYKVVLTKALSLIKG